MYQTFQAVELCCLIILITLKNTSDPAAHVRNILHSQLLYLHGIDNIWVLKNLLWLKLSLHLICSVTLTASSLNVL